MFLPGYDSLTPQGQSRFRQALQRLVFGGSLQYLINADKADYQIITENRAAALDWLRLVNLELKVDDEDQIAYVALDEPNGEWEKEQVRKRDEIALLAILRVALEEERARGGPSHTRLTVMEIRTRYEAKMGANMRLKAKRLEDTLPKFRRMKLIDYRGAPDEADTSILVLPYLLHITPAEIVELTILVQKELNGAEEDDEN